MRYQKQLWAICWTIFSLLGTISAQAICGAAGPSPIPQVAASPAFPKSVITIPVVFHVLYSTATDSIGLTQINSQLEVLNADFRAENTDLPDVIPPYRSRVADMEINFVLASRTPDGQPASGLRYREVPAVPRPFGERFSPDGRRASCYAELGGSDAWCTHCYLNVWVVRNSLFAGQGVFPTEVGNETPRAEDGIYINPDRVGTVGTVTAPYNLGRTLTHEIGHYLNLYHLWGPTFPDQEDCTFDTCCDGIYDDAVADTPAQWRTYQGECPMGTAAPNSCFDASPDLPDNYQNFMTFADDACLLMFTQGQKERVRQSLQQYRPGLLDANCTDQCVTVAAEPAKLPGRAWVSQAVLCLEGIPAGVSLEWRSLTGQRLVSWVSPGPHFYQQALPAGPAGVYILVWHWQGRTGGQLLLR